MLSDTEFEHKVREAGYKPTLLQLGWMRWAFDLGVELASQTNRPAVPAVPVLARFAGSLTGMGGGTVVRSEDPPIGQKTP